MKIILIITPMMDFNREGNLIPVEMDKLRVNPNYGIYLLAAILQERGYYVVLIDLVAQGSLNVAPYTADIENCSLIGIGGTTFSWPSALDVIKAIRQIRKDVPIVLGGIHHTIFDRYILKKFPVQYIVRGEGEVALLSLCNHLKNKRDLANVPNLSWINSSSEFIRNSIAPSISDEELSTLPLPGYDRLPFNAYQYLSIESSRGCVHDCSFCSTPYRRSCRFIPAECFVDRLSKSMKYLNRTISKQIQVVDEEFTINPKRTMDIARIIKERGLKPRLRYASRVKDVLVDGFVESLADITANIFLGAECGYDEGLKIAGENITRGLIQSAAGKLEQHNLSQKTVFSFIIGLPWETKTEIEQTIRLAFDLINDFGIEVAIHWYLQIPGSQLWHNARNNQLFNESMYDSYNFSHNPYFFRGGLLLKPNEVWEINDMILDYKHITQQRYPHREMILYNTPEAMIRYFPKEILSEEGHELANLQELSLSAPNHSNPFTS